MAFEKDKNSNLSRRMLLLLESVHATREDIHKAVRDELVSRYLESQ